MTQSFTKFHYQGSPNTYTAFGGLPLFLEMAEACGLKEAINNQLQLNTQGWPDDKLLFAIMLLNMSGGDSLEDIDRLEADEGLKSLLHHRACEGMSRKERRAYKLRFRKNKERALPSSSALRRYVEKFHHEEEEQKRIKGEAFIPSQNQALKSLVRINKHLMNFASTHDPVEVATLDQDATLAETHKRQALYCYKKYKAYQPLNTYWHEQSLLLHSEFRDGNVPAGFEQLRVLKESLEFLPPEVKKVLVRSDSAGYQEELLRYCAEGKNERFGVIEFAVAAKVTQAFKTAVGKVDEAEWHPIIKEDESGNSIKTDQEFAEVCFVPSWAGKRKGSPEYRFIAIRERFITQPSLLGLEDTQQPELPFQTLVMKKGEYKLFGLVTNRKLPGNDLINWLRKRCGDSEKVHNIQKTDLAGGQFPSNKFGANAAWWQIMVLSFNIIVLMKNLVLPEFLKTKRMKGLRFHLINIAGNVVTHARSLIVKVSQHPTVLGLLLEVRRKIEALTKPPPKEVNMMA